MIRDYSKGMTTIIGDRPGREDLRAIGGYLGVHVPASKSVSTHRNEGLGGYHASSNLFCG